MQPEPPIVNPAVDAVVEHLRADHGLESLHSAGPPTRLTGGFWAEMWVVDLIGTPSGWPARLVIRLAPDPGSAVREIVIQAGVAARGYPTPTIRGSGVLAETGSAWSVMDFAAGRPLLDGLDGLAALRALPRIARELPEHLGATMAMLHALPTAALREDLERIAPGTVGIDGYLTYLGAEIDRLDATSLRAPLDRLLAARPDPGPEVICHGDLHPFNVLLADDGPVVIDWTASRIAHPAYDVANTSLLLEIPPLAAPAPLDRIMRVAARWLARRFRARYLAHGGMRFSAETLAWYEDLDAVRILLEVEQWRDREGADLASGHPFLLMAPTLRGRLEQSRA